MIWASAPCGAGRALATSYFPAGTAPPSGQVIVADGTEEAARRLKRVLTNDPALGVYRHADAGYEAAVRCAREEGLKMPMEHTTSAL